MDDLIHLIYNSVATSSDVEQDLQAILQVSRNKNAAAKITGMLLFADGSFFQVLEGPADAVDHAAEVISKDPRHARMTIIIREPIAKRAFGEWTMGMARLTAEEVRNTEGLNDLFQSGRVLEDINQGRAKKLLQAFQQGRWRVKLTPGLTPAHVAVSPVGVPSAPTESRTVEAMAAVRPPYSFAYQPIIDAQGQRVVGYEALVRGPQEEPATAVLNRVPLEDIAAFDDDARRVAIALAARLGMRGNLHLNLMPQMRNEQPQTLDDTIDTARRCGLSPDRLVIELKHEATVANPRELVEWIKPYRAQGVHISIDDFGSGHAGLALLDRYQPDLITLSMWLVRDIGAHGPRQAILCGLMQICTDLGIDIIAKGVETEAEYTWLKDGGINLFQGNLFAKAGFESLPRPMLPMAWE